MSLFITLEGTDVLSLSDRALIAVMLYGFVRVGAACSMRVRDFVDDPGGAWPLPHEKGGKSPDATGITID